MRQARFARALLVLAALAVAAVVLVVALVGSLNPFGTTEVDRSPPAVLRSLSRLSEFRAASANLQQVVDVEQDTILPSFLAGERTLILAAGRVDAAVDLRQLRGDALQVSEDRKAVTMTLPAPRLTPPQLDLRQTRVIDAKRGLGNRIVDLFSDDADQQRKLLALAQDKLAVAAAADPGLLQAAERNTRDTLTGLLRGLGFERVTIRFAPRQV